MPTNTDGMRAEGNDTFTVFAGGADTVVEAFRVRVEVGGEAWRVEQQRE